MRHILLTAAVTPNVSGPVARSEPSLRLRDYVAAARAWSAVAAETGCRLTIAETTGFGAAEIARRADLASVGTLDTVPGDAVRARGKGAAEAACIDEFVSGIDDGDFVTKVTGRLRARNGAAIVRRMDRGLYLRMSYGRAWVDTRMFAMDVCVWRYRFAGVGARVDDERQIYLEHAMGAQALRAVADGERVRPLPERPRWVGTSGSTARPYRWNGYLSGRLIDGFEAALRRTLDRKLL